MTPLYALVVAAMSCAAPVDSGPNGNYGFEVVNVYPHDPDAFTQGLVYDDGFLYEGTGRYGHSSLRKVDLTTGEVVQSYELPDEYFGEGITVFDDRIYQLTYRENTGFVYDKETFEIIDQFTYPTEGWGLTSDSERLIMSDGTATLRFLDPNTYEETGRVGVIYRGEPLIRLNELEFIEGYVYANVWPTDLIVIIDPESGEVVGRADMDGLQRFKGLFGSSDVLNGIAYDIGGDRLFVTGKRWPKLYEIELISDED
jgi:glutamine cyclotransferase